MTSAQAHALQTLSFFKYFSFVFSSIGVSGIFLQERYGLHGFGDSVIVCSAVVGGLFLGRFHKIHTDAGLQKAAGILCIGVALLGFLVMHAQYVFGTLLYDGEWIPEVNAWRTVAVLVWLNMRPSIIFTGLFTLCFLFAPGSRR